jgi:membrane associated rhomboid family serine protease
MIPLRDNLPSSTHPVITILLILVCAAVFLYVFYGLASEAAVQRVVMNYGAVPAHLLAPGGLTEAAPTLVTSLFLHGSWLHLGGNMLYLWIFGDNVEDWMGHTGFLFFYLLSGAVATVSHALLNPTSTAPLVGASGAIAGVLGAYLVLFPRARIRSLAILGYYVTTVSIPAVVYLPLWFLLQFFSGVASLGAAGGGGVAWWAHVGGFVTGIVLVPVFSRRRGSQGAW